MFSGRVSHQTKTRLISAYLGTSLNVNEKTTTNLVKKKKKKSEQKRFIRQFFRHAVLLSAKTQENDNF